MSKQIRNGCLWAIAVGLVCGVAWAAQTESISIPPNPVRWATADVVPGAEGMVLYRIREEAWEDGEDLKIGFDPEGSLTVNGEEVASYHGDHAHRVHGYYYELPGGDWACDLTVVDLDTQQVLHSEYGRDAGDHGPTVCTATADVILSLTSG